MNNNSGFIGLIIAALMYTAVGLLAGLIYTLIAPALALPQVGMGVTLGIWWLWFLFISPPIIFYVSVLRATDPLAKLAEALAPKVPKQEETE